MSHSLGAGGLCRAAVSFVGDSQPLVRDGTGARQACVFTRSAVSPTDSFHAVAPPMYSLTFSSDDA